MAISLGYGREHWSTKLLGRVRVRHLIFVPLLTALTYVAYFHHGWFSGPIVMLYRESTLFPGNPPEVVVRSVVDRNYYLSERKFEHWMPRSWRAILEAGLPIDEPPVYIGRVSHSSGRTRLVAITMVPQTPTRLPQAVLLRAWVFEPGTWKSTPIRVWKGTPVATVNPQILSLRLYAGEAIPKTPGSLEIEYHLDQVSSFITGQLEADDTVTLTVPALPVAAPALAMANPRWNGNPSAPSAPGGGSTGPRVPWSVVVTQAPSPEVPFTGLLSVKDDAAPAADSSSIRIRRAPTRKVTQPSLNSLIVAYPTWDASGRRVTQPDRPLSHVFPYMSIQSAAEMLRGEGPPTVDFDPSRIVLNPAPPTTQPRP